MTSLSKSHLLFGVAETIDISGIVAQYDNGEVKKPYTGEVIKLDELRRDRYPSYDGETVASEIKYTYINTKGNEVNEADLTGPGTYYVIITFPDLDADFKLSEDIRITRFSHEQFSISFNFITDL